MGKERRAQDGRSDAQVRAAPEDLVVAIAVCPARRLYRGTERRMTTTQQYHARAVLPQLNDRPVDNQPGRTRFLIHSLHD